MPDRNCLSYWFPKLQAAGIPTPRTEIVRTSLDLIHLCDGKEPPPVKAETFTMFMNELRAAAELVQPTHGSPVFLRTGQGSGKHDWLRCCYVPDLGELTAHVASLVEWSHMVDMMGLATDVWAVREYLPTPPLAYLPTYGGMPLVPEVRAFVQGGVPICLHPYWPEKSIRKGLRCDHPAPGNVLTAKCPTCDTEATDLFIRALDPVGRMDVLNLVQRVAVAFAHDGAWSVDVLPTDRGLYVTDMAEAGRSYHYDGCQNRALFGGTPPADAEPGEPIGLERLLDADFGTVANP